MDTQHAFYNENTGIYGPGHRAPGSPVKISRDAGRTTGQGQGSDSKDSTVHIVAKIPPSKEAPGAAAGMDFVAIDVETANRRRSSICQVGIAVFKSGKCVDVKEILVNPEEEFDRACVNVHGIEAERVVGAAVFADVYRDFIHPLLNEQVVVSHTGFDRTSIESACTRCSLDYPDSRWLDSAQLVRRTWRDRASSGYGLAPVAEMLGIELDHHNAGDDARVAGMIAVEAAGLLGLDLSACLVRSRLSVAVAYGDKKKKTYPSRKKRPAREPRTASELELTLDEAVATAVDQGLEPLEGQQFVFTGTLTLVRNEAEYEVEALGGAAGRSVTKRTTVVVVGEQNAAALSPGQTKSVKHRKAEKLIGQGQDITILGENDFVGWVRAICEKPRPSAPTVAPPRAKPTERLPK